MMAFAEFHQFLRMPILVQHFVEHTKMEPGITFFEFLELHYVKQYIVDADYQRDNQLPFRAADCCVNNAGITCECPDDGIELETCSFAIKQEFILLDEDNSSLLSVTDIFQPPRSC